MRDNLQEALQTFNGGNWTVGKHMMTMVIQLKQK
jgi:hypothetical protein